MGKPQPPALHARRHHLKGLPCTHAVGKQRIVPVQDMRHRIFLVRHHGNLRIHAHKPDMAPVILTGADAVEQFIIGFTQRLPPVKVFEHPFLKGFPDHLLLLLGHHGLRFIQDTFLFPVLRCYLIVYLGIPQV